MERPLRALCIAAALIAAPAALRAGTTPFSFDSGTPDGKIGVLTRPGTTGVLEHEAADDFLLTQPTKINSATFSGLLTNGATSANIGQVVVEIYRVFPKDSTNPPSGNVPTRNNSPSDVAFDSRDSAGSGLSFTTTTVAASFTVSNSVINGINKSPNQQTLGEGAQTGQEVQLSVTFATPFDLPADHYFFVPQVEVLPTITTTAGTRGLQPTGEFLWLSSAKPIVGGTPFLPDLQSWTRDANLDPDWLRVGTDIVGAGAFNASFTLSGTATTPTAVPLPAPWALGSLGLLTLAGASAVRRRSGAQQA